jgi:hypothetical protein
VRGVQFPFFPNSVECIAFHFCTRHHCTWIFNTLLSHRRRQLGEKKTLHPTYHLISLFLSLFSLSHTFFLTLYSHHGT